MGVDEANSASGEASKGSMHGALPQHLAVDAVIGGGGNGSDHVGRINVLDVNALHIQHGFSVLQAPAIKLSETSNPCHAKRATPLKPWTLQPSDLWRIRTTSLRSARV